jgi:lipopolysaccharide export system permease protein
MRPPLRIWRHTLAEVVSYTLLGLVLMALVLLVQQLLRYLDELLAADLGGPELLGLATLILPTYLAYAVPTALLFGVLLALGRMSADGEIVALSASGISIPHLLPPVLSLALLGVASTAWLVFEVEPLGQQRLKSRLRELGSSVNVIQPGRFRTLGERTFYVNAAGDPDCPLQGVLIGDFSRAERPLYVSARCGQVSSRRPGEALELQLLDGAVQFSEDATEDRYRVIRFARMRMSVDLEAYLDSVRRARDLTFGELLALDRAYARGEHPRLRGNGPVEVSAQIHRRLAFPLASLLLVLVAVPLGVRPLRAGRSAGALTAVGLMAAYWVMFGIAERVAHGELAPAWLALWAPDVAVASLGVFLLRRSVRAEA